jgi:hypothetical protein
MANVIEVTYTLRQVLLNTYQFFKSRYIYRERDVLKSIHIRKRTYLHPDRPGEPSIKWEISTRSYPQYKPYTNRKYGIKQKTTHHDYDIVLEIDEMSLDTTSWKCRIGSGKKIVKAPEKMVKSISQVTRRKWAKSRDDKLKKALTKEEKQKINDEYKKKIEDHRNKAPYLDQGDYVAQELGVNLDFAYRDAFAFRYYGHLYGKWGVALDRPSKLNPKNIIFAPKHLLRVIEVLMQRGILK